MNSSLAEAIVVQHVEHKEWGNGVCHSLKSNFEERIVDDENGNPVKQTVNVTYMLVSWANVNHPAICEHAPTELVYIGQLIDFRSDNVDPVYVVEFIEKYAQENDVNLDDLIQNVKDELNISEESEDEESEENEDEEEEEEENEEQESQTNQLN